MSIRLRIIKKEPDLMPMYRLYSGRKRLTVQEKETIFATVMEQSKGNHPSVDTAQSKMSSRLKILVSCCVFVLVGIPILWLTAFAQKETEYTSKGHNAVPLFSARCLKEKSPHTCHPGDTMAFRVHGQDNLQFFAAFSKREDADGVIWYFPKSKNETSLSIQKEANEGVIEQAIRLGNEHKLGTYIVYGVFSSLPLKREQIKDLFTEDGRVKKGGTSLVRQARVHIKK